MRARISYVSCLLATLAGLSLAGGQRSAKAGQEPPTEERPAEPVQPGEGDDARDELVRRLRGGDEADSVFARVLRGMDQSYRQLAGRLDAGEQTQHVQTQIMADLDEAIATARRMQSSGQRTGQRLDARRAGSKTRTDPPAPIRLPPPRMRQEAQRKAARAVGCERPDAAGAICPSATARPLFRVCKISTGARTTS
jgi:hypothetical protein